MINSKERSHDETGTSALDGSYTRSGSVPIRNDTVLATDISYNAEGWAETGAGSQSQYELGRPS